MPTPARLSGIALYIMKITAQSVFLFSYLTDEMHHNDLQIVSYNGTYNTCLGTHGILRAYELAIGESESYDIYKKVC